MGHGHCEFFAASSQLTQALCHSLGWRSKRGPDSLLALICHAANLFTVMFFDQVTDKLVVTCRDVGELDTHSMSWITFVRFKGLRPDHLSNDTHRLAIGRPDDDEEVSP